MRPPTPPAITAYQTEPIDNLFLNANLRFNDHSDFDHEWTGDVSASYLVEPTLTTFKAAIGKGYRAPNPYELMPLSPTTHGTGAPRK